jgi:hypothetical protein
MNCRVSDEIDPVERQHGETDRFKDAVVAMNRVGTIHGARSIFRKPGGSVQLPNQRVTAIFFRSVTLLMIMDRTFLIHTSPIHTSASYGTTL